MTTRPLILDVDGTLIRSDLTHELLLEGAKADPLKVPGYALLGLRSKSRLKDVLVRRVGDRIATDALPLEPRTVDLANEAVAQGRDVYLCSGSEQSLVERLSQSLDFVSGAFGTTPDYNLTSENKADFLRERFPEGFDYVGNSSQDYAVWSAAQQGYAIRPPRGAHGHRTASGRDVEILEPRARSIRPLLRAMRPHQWAKNGLIFLVPLLILESLGLNDWAAVLLGFLCMSLLASGTYIINDLSDLHADRRHPSKSRRPLAAGTLSVPAGLAAGFGLIGLALATAAVALPGAFLSVLAAYLALTLTYSFVLKSTALVDVLTLAFLFLVRVAAGAAIVSQPLSPWLISFVLTFFLSLSFIKRYTELVKLTSRGRERAEGRGYSATDAPLVLSLGMMATGMALLSFVLYGVVSDIPALRTKTAVLVVGTLLTYWLMRLWLLAHRESLDDDPVLFAVKDPLSVAIGTVIAAVVVLERVYPL